jgi:hypothetical protein
MQKYRKPYRIKRKKSIFCNRFFWFSILLLIIFGGLFYLVCFFSFFQIREIKISGNQKVESEDLENIIKNNIERRIVFYYTSKSIFLTDKNKIKSEIKKKFPQIKEETLKRELPNIIILEIKERKEVGCYCQSITSSLPVLQTPTPIPTPTPMSTLTPTPIPTPTPQTSPNIIVETNCFFLDETGVIFERVFGDCPLDLVIKDSKKEEINLSQSAVDEETLKIIQEIHRKLKDNIKISVSEYNIEENKLIAKTSDNWEIYFNLEKDIKWQLTQLELILESKIPSEERGNLEYIDLRFSKIFWKFR